MSKEYDIYLEQHRANVVKGYRWLQNNLPELVIAMGKNADLEHQIVFKHDASKNTHEEYDAYDRYFYGKNQSYEVVRDFNYAWLHHIHNNPHHWQHWILINDDATLGTIVVDYMDMPDNYIIEMACDWWAFSWQKENLYEIFDWYDSHKAYIQLSEPTRKTVENVLDKIKTVLDSSRE